MFNTKGFLKQVDEEVKPFMKALCKTQMFSHFIHDAYEYDDNYEVQVFTDVMKLEELGDYLEDYVMDALSPKKWEKRVVDVTPCDLRGLPEGWMCDVGVMGRWEAKVFERDPEVFPALDKELFGDPMKRMKIEPLQGAKEFSFVPEDVKLLKKELKAKAKAKKEK